MNKPPSPVHARPPFTLSPESYSLDEKRAICEGIDESATKIEAAIKSDFESLSPFAQDKLLDLLKQAAAVSILMYVYPVLELDQAVPLTTDERTAVVETEIPKESASTRNAFEGLVRLLRWVYHPPK